MPETTQVTQPDGFASSTFHWPASTDPVGVVFVAHGMGEHSLRYDTFARELAAAGYHVYAAEHRGHGKPAEQNNSLGDFGPAGFPVLASDLVTLVGYARDRHPELPLTLFGHSMGSFVAQLFLLDNSSKVDAAILSGSSALDLLGEALASAPADDGGPFAPFNAAFQPARTDFDWLSRDEKQVDLYIQDPLCGFAAAPDSFGSMLQAGERLADPAKLKCVRPDLPILIFSGDRDPVGGEAAGFVRELKARYEAAGLRRVSLSIYSDGRHEMLNETNRKEVVADVISWLRANT
jgi:alpha-beta hydrolase superfamily lysophospholipase